MCSDTLKSCPNGCSSNGMCIFLDRNGYNDTMANGFKFMDACYVSNKYCVAKCQCDDNYYEDCSMDLSTYNEKIALRESLCDNIVTLTSQQNPTADNIRSISIQISGIYT